MGATENNAYHFDTFNMPITDDIENKIFRAIRKRESVK